LQPIDRLHPQVGQLVATIGEQPQRDQFLVVAELVQPRRTHRDHRHRMCVGRVGLAGVTGVEDPHPGSQLGRHVDHHFTVGQQPLRQWAAHTVGTLDRPPTIRPLVPYVPQHQPISGAVGAEPAGGQLLALLVDSLDRHRLLVWVHTHDHSAHHPTSSLRVANRRGRAELLRAGQSPFEPRLTTAPGGTACQMRATPLQGGQPLLRERPAEHLDPSLARPQS
jgi:hypothetical protein